MCILITAEVVLQMNTMTKNEIFEKFSHVIYRRFKGFKLGLYYPENIDALFQTHDKGATIYHQVVSTHKEYSKLNIDLFIIILMTFDKILIEKTRTEYRTNNDPMFKQNLFEQQCFQDLFKSESTKQPM